MPDTDNPSLEFGFLIYDVTRLLRNRVMDSLGDIGMTEAQWRAIAHLSRMEGCRQADLAQALQIRPITLARVIDRLEAASLVQRRQHSDDRRAFSLYLTARAKPILKILDGLRVDLHEQALQNVSPGDREKLMAILETIQQNLSSGRDSQASPQRSKNRRDR